MKGCFSYPIHRTWSFFSAVWNGKKTVHKKVHMVARCSCVWQIVEHRLFYPLLAGELPVVRAPNCGTKGLQLITVMCVVAINLTMRMQLSINFSIH